jgi:hypothetical protein
MEPKDTKSNKTVYAKLADNEISAIADGVSAQVATKFPNLGRDSETQRMLISRGLKNSKIPESAKENIGETVFEILEKGYNEKKVDNIVTFIEQGLDKHYNPKKAQIQAQSIKPENKVETRLRTENYTIAPNETGNLREYRQRNEESRKILNQEAKESGQVKKQMNQLFDQIDKEENKAGFKQKLSSIVSKIKNKVVSSKASRSSIPNKSQGKSGPSL